MATNNPSPQPPVSLIVAPSSVNLTSGQAQLFTVSPMKQVSWSLHPSGEKYGEIDESTGAYSAPQKMIVQSRTAIVVAEADDKSQGAATIALSSQPFWRNFIGCVLLLLLIPIVLLVKYQWPAPYSTFSPTVTPEHTWAMPGDTVQFSVVQCPMNSRAFTWRLAGGSLGRLSQAGVYTADLLPTGRTEADAFIQAVDANQNVLGTGTIHITASDGLALWPSVIPLAAGGQQTFTLSSTASTDPVWSLDPPVGELKAVEKTPKQHVYIAPSSVGTPILIKVVATIPGSGPSPPRSVVGLAELGISGEADCTPSKSVFWFVFWMGVLGGLIHTAGSFTAFVGSRRFLSSWTWWYVFRPFEGGLLAILVFFLFGGGFFGKADVGNSYMVATYAGLVGLFSEIALLKLKEILLIILKPKDDRSDSLSGSGGAARKPTIASVVKETGGANAYAVTGSGFASGARVKVGTEERPTTFVSESKLTLTLKDTDTGTLKITASNPKPDGTTSDSAPATFTR